MLNIQRGIKARLGSENALFLLVLLFFLFLVLFYWEKTWDDSAITLAFSRNLVKYGDIIPSQFSDRVEGYSTFLWMMINALYFLAGMGEDMVITVAKVTSTILAIANILLFWRLAREKIKQPFYKYVLLVLYTINLQTVTSAVFGMETALYALLVMGSYLLFRVRSQSKIKYIGFIAVSSMLILIRHEGVLFLVPFLVEAIRTNPKQFWREPFIYSWGGVLLAYHTWHITFFGDLLTNPMIAKGQPPYRPELDSLIDLSSYYLYPFFRFTAIYPFLILLIGIYLIRLRNHKEVRHFATDADFSLINGIALMGLFIMLITGRAWISDADRLSYPALAFLFLTLGHYLDMFPLKQLMPPAKGLLVATLSIGFVINAAATYRTFSVNKQFNLTVDRIRRDAQMVTLTQRALNKNRVTFAGPDMGGLLLFEGDGKRVVDLGLLCNRELAKQGYEIVDTYVLMQEKPEIIDIHDNWIEYFARSDLFYKKYTPVRILSEDDEIFLFLRQDLILTLKEQWKIREILFVEENSMQTDLSRLLHSFGRYLVLDLSG